MSTTCMNVPYIYSSHYTQIMLIDSIGSQSRYTKCLFKHWRQHLHVHARRTHAQTIEFVAALLMSLLSCLLPPALHFCADNLCCYLIDWMIDYYLSIIRYTIFAVAALPGSNSSITIVNLLIAFRCVERATRSVYMKWKRREKSTSAAAATAAVTTSFTLNEYELRCDSCVCVCWANAKFCGAKHNMLCSIDRVVHLLSLDQCAQSQDGNYLPSSKSIVNVMVAHRVIYMLSVGHRIVSLVAARATKIDYMRKWVLSCAITYHRMIA